MSNIFYVIEHYKYFSLKLNAAAAAGMAECDFFLNSHEILSRNQSKLCTQGIAHQYAIFDFRGMAQPFDLEELDCF